jgi:hypothetical protein
MPEWSHGGRVDEACELDGYSIAAEGQYGRLVLLSESNG